MNAVHGIAEGARAPLALCKFRQSVAYAITGICKRTSCPHASAGAHTRQAEAARGSGPRRVPRHGRRSAPARSAAQAPRALRGARSLLKPASERHRQQRQKQKYERVRARPAAVSPSALQTVPATKRSRFVNLCSAPIIAQPEATRPCSSLRASLPEDGGARALQTTASLCGPRTHAKRRPVACCHCNERVTKSVGPQSLRAYA